MCSLMRVLVHAHTCMHEHVHTHKHTHTQHACIHTHKYHLHPQPTHIQYRCFLGIQNLPVMKCECLIIVHRLMELQELIENDEQLLEMVQSLPELKSFAEKRESLSEKCVFLASQ